MQTTSKKEKRPKRPYEVDYHAIQVIYFDNDQVFTGPELACVWSGMRRFGEHQVAGAFWQRKGDNFNLGKKARFALGSLEFIQPMLNGDDPIYGGGTVRQKNLSRGTIQDCDFYFTHKDPSRWEGIDTRPDFTLALSDRWLQRIGVEVFLDMLKEHFELADAHCPPYGLIDVASPNDAWAGMVYGSLWMMQSPLHRWVEQGNWVYGASKKGDRVRSIYWGNYFGPKILTRLGGRENFIGRYREQARLKDGTPNAQIWEFTNGVFVSLCLDPLGCKPGLPLDFSAMLNLQWLHKELGSKGALCGWQSDLATGDSETSTKVENTVNAPTQQSFQSLSNLNDAELQWIRDCVNQARYLVKKYLATDASVSLDPATLDRVFGSWLAQWQSGNSLEAPNTMVNCVGLAFGQWLVDSLGMKWTVVTDVNGSDMGVCFGPHATHVLVFPTHAIARRLEMKETGFIQRLFEAIRTQVDGMK